MSAEPRPADPWDRSVVERHVDGLSVELFNDIKPRLDGGWLIKHLLMAESTCVIFGVPGCGKSFLALDMALHIAAGRDWFDRPTKAGGVVYLGAEGQGGLRARVAAWRSIHGGSDVSFALVPTVVDLLDPRQDLGKVSAVLNKLAGIWGGIALLVVDTLAATFGGGDENSGHMATYVANVARLCEPYRCSRLFVTHAPLSGEARRPRGHGSLWGAADAVMEVSGDRDAPARRVHVIKQKDADPGSDIFLKLRPVEIGIDDDGEPVTSCIVEVAELGVCGPSHPALSDTQKIVLAALDRVLIASGTTPPSSIPEAVLNPRRTGKVVHLSEWLAEARAALAAPDKDPDTPRRTFDRAKNKLQAAKIIGVWEDWAWRNF